MAPRILTCALTCALTLLAVRAQLVDLPRSLGELKLANAAFVEAYTAQIGDGDDVSRKTLYVSSFNPGNVIGDDKVYYLRSPGSQLDSVADWDMQVRSTVLTLRTFKIRQQCSLFLPLSFIVNSNYMRIERK